MGWQGLKLICTVSAYFNKLKMFHEFYESPFFNFFLTLKYLSISESCIETKNWVKFLFSHFFVVPQKVLKKVPKTFWGTTKKCENKNLT